MGLVEMHGTVPWEVLIAITRALYSNIREVAGEIRDDLVYIEQGPESRVFVHGDAVAQSGDFLGYAENTVKTLQWNSRWSGAIMTATKLKSANLWGLAFFGPDGCQFHRVCRDAVLASATELAPGR